MYRDISSLMFRLHLNFRRIQGYRPNPYALRFNISPFLHMHPHRTVDSRSGIPSAVRLPFIGHLHADHIFPRFQETIRTDIKGEIAVGAAACLLSVDLHLRIPVYSFKLKRDMLLLYI